MMQLTLDQSEIEEAIANYVSELISVRDGKRIDVDLKATRGADGFTAIVDIVNEDAPQRISDDAPATPAEPAKTVEPNKTLGIVPKVRAARRTAAQIAADNAAAAAQVESGNAATGAASTTTEDQNIASADVPFEADNIPEGEAVDEGSIVEQAAGANVTVDSPAPVTEEAPRRPSLFGNLKPPSNS